MERGRARTFNEDELPDLIDAVVANQAEKANASPPEVIKVAFMLSFYAGLRVQEIAGLDWRIHIFNSKKQFRRGKAPVYSDDGKVVRDKKGKIVTRAVDVFEITAAIGKYGKARTIPVHPRLAKALIELHTLELSNDWVIPSGRTGSDQGLRKRAHALKMRINRTYVALGLERGTTHSGRRSFITRAARLASVHETSLVDVSILAGHSSVKTTEKYVDPSPRQADLVDSLWE